ncbi:hypothetical protein [Ferroglobus sp.]|uniref:hypothetical protein n=1 Tax=Ferroglobus sp. TaxID=2614230 RepID=UPI0025C65DCB|nr:hypothetical protein [Ferroglobus sp.]
MLKRWNTLIYDVELILKFLHVILVSLKIDDRFQKRKGRKPKRLPSLYVKAIVLKEIFRCSLRYSESLARKFLKVRIPKSTLNYWETKHSNLIKEVLKALNGFLSQIEYFYTVIDSTKFSNWNKNLSELFVCVSVGESLVPVYVDLMSSEEEFVAGIPEGNGFALADGAFDTKKVLNELVWKGYLPIVKSTKRKPDGLGSKIRDLFFDKSVYRYRSVGEGYFGALSVEFGDRLKSRGKSDKARILARNVIYCIKIALRWKHGAS